MFWQLLTLEYENTENDILRNLEKRTYDLRKLIVLEVEPNSLCNIANKLLSL